MTPRIGADEGDLDEARIADGLDVRARSSAAEHTLHTYLPYPRKTQVNLWLSEGGGFSFHHLFTATPAWLLGTRRHGETLVVAAHASPSRFIATGAVNARMAVFGRSPAVLSRCTFGGYYAYYICVRANDLEIAIDPIEIIASRENTAKYVQGFLAALRSSDIMRIERKDDNKLHVAGLKMVDASYVKAFIEVGAERHGSIKRIKAEIDKYFDVASATATSA